MSFTKLNRDGAEWHFEPADTDYIDEYCAKCSEQRFSMCMYCRQKHLKSRQMWLFHATFAVPTERAFGFY